MPPLRDRIEDLPELARLFLDRYKAKFRKPVRGISGSALKILASYWWPGNIRELENLIERLVAVSDKEWITDEDLPLEYHFAKLDSDSPPRGYAVPGGLRHVRAQLHPAGAREVGLERDRHRPLPRDPAQHAQAQDVASSICGTSRGSCAGADRAVAPSTTGQLLAGPANGLADQAREPASCATSAHLSPFQRVTSTVCISEALELAPSMRLFGRYLWAGIPVAPQPTGARARANLLYPRSPRFDSAWQGARMQPSMFNVRVPLDDVAGRGTTCS